MKRAAYFACLALLLAACADAPARSGREAAPERAAGAPPEKTLPADYGLGARAFASLPGEARAYLRALGAAFAAGEAAFLAAQGESSFEAAVRPGRSQAEYLALLYRAGPYAAPDAAGALSFSLDPAAVRAIVYERWREAGPLLEVEARLEEKSGEALPCRLLLVWRLVEPKIEGLFP